MSWHKCRHRWISLAAIVGRLADLDAAGVDVDALPDDMEIFELFKSIDFFKKWTRT